MQPSLGPTTTLLLPLAAVLVVSAAGYFGLHGDGRKTVAGEVQSSQQAPEPMLLVAPTVIPDRTTCEEIDGSEYRSDAERAWYLAHCVVTALTAQLAAPAPTATPQPSPTPASTGTPGTATSQPNAGPPGACLDPDTTPGAPPTAGCAGSPSATPTPTSIRRATATPTSRSQESNRNRSRD